MRCPQCGKKLKTKRLSADGVISCPRCGNGIVGEPIPSVGIEPLPPKPGSSRIPGCTAPALMVGAVVLTLWILFGCFVPAMSSPREPTYRMSCANNLKQIAIALHNYHDTYKSLPAQSITDGEGRPMHSWRLAILPFLEHSPRYDRYDFDQPWDSPHNRDVCRDPVPAYRCPSSDIESNSNLTNYFVVYGDATMFGPDRWTRFSDVTDGLSNTVMVVECDSEAMRVEWSEPRDIPFDRMTFRLDSPDSVGPSSEHYGGVQVAMGDGSVRFVSQDAVDERTFRYSLIRDDGQNVQLP